MSWPLDALATKRERKNEKEDLWVKIGFNKGGFMTPEQAIEVIKILRSIDITNYMIMICAAVLIGIMLGKNWF